MSFSPLSNSGDSSFPSGPPEPNSFGSSDRSQPNQFGSLPSPRPAPHGGHHADSEAEPPLRGDHTLRVHKGQIVGIFGGDVFVDLGPRLQGVLPKDSFPQPPREGDVHEFTMRGREESLWVLALAGTRSSHSWLGMQEGQWVSARVVREHQGHLQLKVDGLHAVMPHAHTGKSPGQSLRGLIGKNLVCEVLEVDPERERVVLSRKRVVKRQREQKARKGQLLPGDVTRGRVVRLETYGAFLRLNGGREGLLHISDMSFGHIDHPADRLELGQTIEVKVLRLSHKGKRIALGVKQLAGNPWKAFQRAHPPGSLLAGEVFELEDAGVRIDLDGQITAWIPRSETPFGQRRLGVFLRRGQSIAMRVLRVSEQDEEIVLSMLDTCGRPLQLADLHAAKEWKENGRSHKGQEDSAPNGTSLGDKLREAFGQKKQA